METSTRKNCFENKFLPCNNNNPTINRKSSKVQYFTFGKDNCLIHHPTSHDTKSTASAIFCKTNPFTTQSNKSCHKKLKSTFQIPYKENAAIKRVALAKITKDLKQTSVTDSDFSSMVVKGVSLKLEPKKRSVISPHCGSSYCTGVRRCKMCGDILLDVHSGKSSVIKDHTDFIPDKTVTDITHKDKIESILHKNMPKIKRCVLCSDLFRQSSNTGSSDESLEIEQQNKGLITSRDRISLVKRNSGKMAEQSLRLQNQPSTVQSKSNNKPSSSRNVQDINQARLFNKKPSQTASVTSSKRTYKIASDISLGDQANTYTKFNTAQHVISSKPLSSYSKQSVEDINKEKLLNKKSSQTKSDASSKRTFKVPSNVTLQSKSLPMSNRLVSEPRITTEMYLAKGYEKTKNSITDTYRTSAKTASQSTSMKSSGTNLTLKPQSVTDKLTSKSYRNQKEYDPKNLTNKIASTKPTKMSNKANSLPISSVKNQAEIDANIFLNSCLTVKKCKSTSVLNGNAVRKSRKRIVPYSWPEMNLQSTNSYGLSESLVSESNANRKNTNISSSSKRDFSIAESSSSIDTTSSSLSETNQSCNSLSGTSQSNINSKTVSKTCTNKEDETTMQTYKEPSSETSVMTSHSSSNSSSKSVEDNTLENSVEVQTPSSPASQNVTVNNYYFLSSCDLKNLSAKCKNYRYSANDHFALENLISNSENGVSNETTDTPNESNLKSVNSEISLKNSKTFSSQSNLPKSALVLGGLFKHNTENYSYNTCASQFDKISLSKNSYTTLENDQICGLPSNLHAIPRRQEMTMQGVDYYIRKEFQLSQDVRSLYGIKSPNPFVQQSVMIFEEMDNVRNESIDPEKILEELKKNKQLMKSIHQMASKKLNFPRKTTVFKDLTSK